LPRELFRERLNFTMFWKTNFMQKEFKYTNGKLTVIWRPALCQHAGICVKMLPNVYHPDERPWIKIENASTQELIEQVGKCPSAALTYRMNQ
jgi:uncharacterized Fe-S cluster protein YjdI